MGENKEIILFITPTSTFYPISLEKWLKIINMNQ